MQIDVYGEHGERALDLFEDVGGAGRPEKGLGFSL